MVTLSPKRLPIFSGFLHLRVFLLLQLEVRPKNIFSADILSIRSLSDKQILQRNVRNKTKILSSYFRTE
jgi:hypothetical protein